MAVLKGQLIDNETGNILYPQTSLDMVEGAEIVDPMVTTEEGFIADAKKTKEAIIELESKLGTQATMVLSGTTLTITTK